MSKATDRIEAMEVEREMLGNLASINGAVQGLASVVEFENQRFGERLGLVERRQCQLEQILQQIITLLGEERDASDWWKTGRNGNGGGP